MAKLESAQLKVCAEAHNGHPDYRVPDRVNKDEMVGGQVAMIRGLMDFKTFCIAVGRRVGKSTGRGFFYLGKANVTPGIFRAGFIAQDHAKAYEFMQYCIEQYGGDPRVVGKANTIVTEVVGGPKDQRRYIRTKAIGIGRTLEQVINKGMEIWFWSGQHPHYEKIRGYMFKFDHIDLDEAQLLHPDILNVVNSMLMDSDGSMGISGTPNADGIGNEWFEEFYQMGLDPTQPDFGCMNVPSRAGVGYTIKSEEALMRMKARCRTDEDWQQEGMAEFLKGRGAVFGRLADVFVLQPMAELPKWYYRIWSEIYDREGSVGGENVFAWVYENPEERARYVMSVDWARVRDATVISIFRLDTMEQVAVFCFRGEEYEEYVEWVSRLHELYGNAQIHSDQNGVGDSMTRTLQRRFHEGCIGYPSAWWSGQKSGAVRDAQMLFNHVEIKMIDCQTQRHEFKTYKRDKSEATGRVTYSAQIGGNDDFVACLLMMAETLRSGSRPMLVAPKKRPRWHSWEWFEEKRKRKRRRDKVSRGLI